ncbi:MAG: hypothetical protein ACK42F_03085, partial [Sphingobacteriales bacterium]
MRTQHRISIAWYVAGDFLSSSIAWAFFFILRKILLKETVPDVILQSFSDSNFWIGILLIPLGWVFLFALTG